jgi:arabinose-5-phosphate isomerase
MQTGDDIPQVPTDATLSQAMLEMTRAGIGMTAITNSANEVLGIFTDGDLRRVFEDKVDPHQSNIDDIMTRHCTTVTVDMLAAEGLQIMQQKKINSLLVTDENQKLIGALNMHTLLRAGVA